MDVVKISNISISFGGLKAVSDFSLSLRRGELVGLIGPNGAGKTTIFNMLTGVYTPGSGEILIKKIIGDKEEMVSIVGVKPHKITQMGVARTFQNIRLFKEMSVLDNVRLAFDYGVKYNPLQAMLKTPAFKREEERVNNDALDILKIFKLEEKAEEKSKNLSYGDQRKLEIARALAASPRVLLLDEPAAGMNPQETQELMHLIERIRENYNLTILLIEHDMHLVMSICERIVVLDHGNIIANGTPEEVSNSPEVIKAYLGEGDVQNA